MNHFHSLFRNLSIAGILALTGGLNASAQTGGIELIGANLSTRGALVQGIYSFNATSNSAYSLLVPDIELNGGAMYANGKYYGLTYDYDNNQNITVCKWLRYDPEVWALEAEVDCPLNDYTYIAIDRTFDSSTGKAYGLTYDRTATTTQLSTTDLNTGAATLVGDFPENVTMICITSDNKGHLYTIDSMANLYSVNPQTAAATLIGNTAIFDQYDSDYTQSIAYDTASDCIYWAEFHTEGFFQPKGALYKINPSNASTVKIADLPDRAEITGLYIPEQGMPGTPVAPSNLTWQASAPGSTAIRFSFVMPSMTCDGKTLNASEPLGIEIMVDNETIDLLEALPGKSVTTEYYSLTRGLHTVKIHAESADGIGKNASVRLFAGYDVPAAPANITLVASGSRADLSWTALAIGAEGGDICPPITYTVKRMPGEVTVASAISATSFSETISNPGYYYYQVIPATAQGNGAVGTSPGAVIGEFTVPFSESFDQPESANLFAVLDLNQDERTWAYAEAENCLRYSYSVTNEADDAVLTPAILLDASKGYELSFNMYKYLAGYNEIVEVYFGNSSDLNSMTRIATITDMDVTPTPYSFLVAPSASGPHYFAFKAISPKNQMFIYLDDLNVIEKGSSAIPARIDDITVTAEGSAYRDLKLSFKAPSTTLGGATLSALSSIVIYRDALSMPIATINAPAPGASLSYTDANVAIGSHTYRLIAINAAGESQEAVVSAYAGIDTPLPVSDVRFSFNEENHPVVTWTAPACGVQGGSLEGLLTYTVIRVANNVELARFEVAGDETEFVDSDYVVEGQAFLYYGVIASTASGSSAQVNSSSEIVGEPYEYPFTESFPNGAPEHNPWFIVKLAGSQPGWSIVKQSSNMDPTVRPYDGDGGMAEFDGYHIFSGESRLISPRIYIGNLVNPRLQFAFYHYRGNSWSGEVGESYVREKMQVEIAMNDGEYESIPNGLYKLYGAKNGWVLYELPLEAYKDSRYVNFGFRGIPAGDYNMYLDAITLLADRKSGIEGVDSSDLHIITVEDGIMYRGLDADDTLHVYNVNGMLVDTAKETEGHIALAPGLYIVRTATSSLKIAVK